MGFIQSTLKTFTGSSEIRIFALFSLWEAHGQYGQLINRAANRCASSIFQNTCKKEEKVVGDINTY